MKLHPYPFLLLSGTSLCHTYFGILLEKQSKPTNKPNENKQNPPPIEENNAKCFCAGCWRISRGQSRVKLHKPGYERYHSISELWRNWSQELENPGVRRHSR